MINHPEGGRYISTAIIYRLEAGHVYGHLRRMQLLANFHRCPERNARRLKCFTPDTYVMFAVALDSAALRHFLNFLLPVVRDLFKAGIQRVRVVLDPRKGILHHVLSRDSLLFDLRFPVLLFCHFILLLSIHSGFNERP